jgi:hypothetical protein
MIRRSVVTVAGLAMLLALAPVAIAQTVAVAHLSGAVVDSSGGVLPGAEVTVTQTSTGMTRFVITGAQGDFSFASLPIGPYKLAAKLTGFRTFEQTGINLNVGDTRSVSVVLQVGSMTETIQVQADASMVETRSLSTGTVTYEEQLVGLPLNGRSATQLVLLSGGAMEVGGTDDRQPAGAIAIAVGGGSGTSTLYLVDGGYNNDPQQNSGNAIPFPDALQEFRVEAGVRDARFGMSTAATVNAVTKSGTNAFHGNAFEFARHYKFNSKSFFERTENGGLGRNDGLKRHQFGGTFGGPIMRDKLFFFAGLQITDSYNVPLNSTVVVPTAEVLRGDFRRIMSPACRGGTARTLGWPFVNNQVDPSLYHPISLKIMSMVPVADPARDPDGCGTHVTARPNDQLDKQFVGRADYQITQNKRVFVRDFVATNFHPALWDPANPDLTDTQGNTGRGLRGLQHTISTGLDYVVSPNLFSSTRFSMQHTESFREHGPCVPTWATLGVKTWIYTNSIDANGNPGCSTTPGQNQLKGGLWSSANTGIFYVDTPSFSQDFDWTKGAHNISFGGSWTRPHSDGDGTFAADGSMGFSGIYTSGTTQTNGGLNMADFVLGFPSSYSGAGSQINNAWVQSPGFYFNDSWRVSRRVTLNMGMRWEPYISVKDANGFNTAFIRQNYDQGIRSTVYTNAPIGIVFNGDPGFPTDGGNTENSLAQFAPRFGFVWDPNGDNVQTIRAGVGVYYESPKLWTTAHIPLNPPFGNDVTATNPTSCPQYQFTSGGQKGCPLVYNDVWNATPGGDPQAHLAHQGEPVRLPAKDIRFPQNGAYKSQPIEVNTETSYQYNLSYQRQLMDRMLVEVTYTGSQTRHTNLPGYSENPTLYIPGNCQAGEYALTAAGPCSNTTAANRKARSILNILNPVEGAAFAPNSIAQMYPNGSAHYNAVKFSVNKRLADNWSATANYTLGSCIDQGQPGTNIGANSFPVPQIDPYNNPVPDPKTSEGYCNHDRRHQLNLTAIAITPGLGSGILDVITKDWQVGFILVTRSGAPVTPGVTGDPNLTGNPQRAVVVPGVDPNLPDDQRVWVLDGNGYRDYMPWFNAAAFTTPTPSTDIATQWGDAKRNSLRGPHFWNADLAFSRNINMAGGRRIEVRVEAFNLFDTVNWGTPSFSAGSTAVNNGAINNTTGDPRIMQFALKYSF